MERYKPVLLIATLAALLIAGCIGEETAVSALQIKTRALKSINELKTYKFSADVVFEAIMRNETESFTNTTVMRSVGKVDLENKKAYMRTDSEPINTSSLWYIIGGVVYIGTENETTVWRKYNLTESEKTWENLNRIKFVEELLNISDVERLEDENIDGVSCYVLKMIPDLNKYYALIANQTGSPSGEGISNVNVSNFIKEWEVKCWITKEANLVKKIYTYLVLNFSLITTSFQMKLSVDMLLYDYNEPVEIVLPEEAKNAQWQGESGEQLSQMP